MQQIDMPNDWRPATSLGKQIEGTVLIPTDDGSYARVYEPKRTVGYGDEEVELRQLTAEEKAWRRFKRNVIMWTIGTLILSGAMYLLTQGVLF